MTCDSDINKCECQKQRYNDIFINIEHMKTTVTVNLSLLPFQCKLVQSGKHLQR